MATLGDEQVGGFDVAMDNAFGMGGIERVGDFNGQRQRRFVVQWAPRYAMLQCHAIKELHGNEALAMLIIDFVDSTNVRMVQGGSSLGFTLKATQRLRIFGNV